MKIINNLPITTEKALQNFSLACKLLGETEQTKRILIEWRTKVVRYHFCPYIEAMIINEDSLYEELVNDNVQAIDWLKSNNPVKFYMAAYYVLSQLEDAPFLVEDYYEELEIIRTSKIQWHTVFTRFQYTLLDFSIMARNYHNSMKIYCEECGEEVPHRDAHIEYIPAHFDEYYGGCADDHRFTCAKIGISF